MGDEKEAKAAGPIDEGGFRSGFFRNAGIATEARRPVGYCNPPEKTRFAQGQSGNPKGRPKGGGKSNRQDRDQSLSPAFSPGLDAIRRRQVAVPIKVRDGERIRDLHVLDALISQIHKLAFAGGVQANRIALQWHEQTLRALDAEHQGNVEWLAHYRAGFLELSSACERSGTAMSDWVPRPEDIHLTREAGLRISGPYTPDMAEGHLLLKRWRDAMHIKMVYDQTVFLGRHGGGQGSLTHAEFLVIWLDRVLPKRWRLASPEMRSREAELATMPRQRLIERFEEAFGAIGLKAPLDVPAPPVAAKILRACGIDPKHIKIRRGTM